MSQHLPLTDISEKKMVSKLQIMKMPQDPEDHLKNGKTAEHQHRRRVFLPNAKQVTHTSYSISLDVLQDKVTTVTSYHLHFHFHSTYHIHTNHYY